MRFISLGLCITACIGCGSSSNSNSNSSGLDKLDHVVVIYLENHSFDNLYGEFDGAENLAKAANAPKQIDASGNVMTTLPPVTDTSKNPPAVDMRFPADLPNAPFDIDQYAGEDMEIPDLVHRYYQEQQQIHSGMMDRFVAVSNAKALAMGYYHTAPLPLAALAKQYTLCDRFFHGAFGGSFLNHIWLISAAAPRFPNAPAAMVAALDGSGNLMSDGAVTPDGYVVNTSYSVNAPHPAKSDPAKLVPNQTMATIGDRLSDASIDWAWYSGGWTDALSGNAGADFQFHHQPFIYFDRYKDGAQAKADHLKDEQDFMSALSAGKIPSVVFIKPVGKNNEHPGYADVIDGERHVSDLIAAITSSSIWKSTAVIVTYDENGGFWDHVSPPTRDRWGPGTRVPALVISPYARKGFVDSTQYATESILALIEHRFHLAALGTADATAADMSAAFDFTQKP